MTTEELLEKRRMERLKRIERIIEKSNKQHQEKNQNINWLPVVNKEESNVYAFEA